jgi:hypothetical protein
MGYNMIAPLALKAMFWFFPIVWAYRPYTMGYNMVAPLALKAMFWFFPIVWAYRPYTMGYNMVAPLALKASHDVLVQLELRTVAKRQRRENIAAHSVGPVGPNYG